MCWQNELPREAKPPSAASHEKVPQCENMSLSIRVFRKSFCFQNQTWVVLFQYVKRYKVQSVQIFVGSDHFSPKLNIFKV